MYLADFSLYLQQKSTYQHQSKRYGIHLQSGY